MATSTNPMDEMQAEVFKAMGHPTRLQIVRFLGSEEHMVTDIVKAVGAEQSNVSRHLSLLRQAGILSSRKEGLRVFYRMSSPALVEAMSRILSCIPDMLRLRLRVSGSMLAEAADPPDPAPSDEDA